MRTPLSYAFLVFTTIVFVSCAPKSFLNKEDASKKWSAEEEEEEGEAGKWPSPAEIEEWGKKELKGDVLFPKSLGYLIQSSLTNTRFSSKFGVIVMVESEEDVQKSILFCIRYDLRCTVKSGGHDYVGRSGGHYTLSINMGRMKGLTVNKADDNSPTGASTMVEPGNRWSDVYLKVDQEGYVVVGGSAHTVSPGGYTTGGGHSPMSRMYGLSVDNTIGFTLVTPEGNMIKMTKSGGFIKKVGESTWQTYNDPELFWAVRGGGGSFGVVTSFTYQLHVAPEGGFCHYFSYYPIYHPLFGRVGDKIIDKWNTILLNDLTKNWGGYVVISSGGYEAAKVHVPVPRAMLKGHLLTSLLHVGDCEEAKPGLDLLTNIYPEYQFVSTVTNFSCFWEYEKNVDDPIGYRTYIINRLLQAEDLSPNSTFSTEVVTDIVHAKKDIGCTWAMLGGQVSKPSLESAVTPDFRTSYGSLSCGVGWEKEVDDEEHIKAMQEYGVKLYKYGRGQYYNEPDYYIENWKEDFWGSMERYNRLLSVKKKYDPKHLFSCHKCVGSDIDY